MRKVRYLIFIIAIMISWTVPASDLFDAVKEAKPMGISLGPLTACFDKMREITCPIMGRIPIIKDVIGEVSLLTGMTCPTGQPVSKPEPEE